MVEEPRLVLMGPNLGDPLVRLLQAEGPNEKFASL
jgi:hypothetical protein